MPPPTGARGGDLWAERLGKLPLFDSCATHLAAVQGRFQRQRAMQRGLLRDVSLQGPLWKQYAQPMMCRAVCIPDTNTNTRTHAQT